MYKTTGELVDIFCISTMKMNRKLEEERLQYKRKEQHWVRWKWALTEEGKLYGKMYATCAFPKIVWKTPDIVVRLSPITGK